VDFFNLTNSSSRSMTLVSTEPLTEVSTKYLSEGKKLLACRVDNIVPIYEPMSENMGASTSRNTKGL
jgi:hypothetical protein